LEFRLHYHQKSKPRLGSNLGFSNPTLVYQTQPWFFKPNLGFFNPTLVFSTQARLDGKFNRGLIDPT
jgi:hypothetical protein